MTRRGPFRQTGDPILIPGLEYFPDYLSDSFHNVLLRIVDESPWEQRLRRRRVQQHEYEYDYKRRAVREIGALPTWAQSLAIGFHERGLTPWIANQLIVNEYEPGRGISAHIDLPLFEGTIASLSLGSTCIMDFTKHNADHVEKKSLLLEPRSLLVISDAARHDWYHSIPARKHDDWNNSKVRRSRRLSLTFRKVR